MAMPPEWPQYRTNVPYANKSSLNTLQTCIPRPTSAHDRRRLWLIFVHGGAWRDPAITAASFAATCDRLLADSATLDHLAGLASVDYRLSPYPSHAGDPSNPQDPARNATHPDHVNDLLAAVLHLQETYCFGERYLLVGHSAGATMALQLTMKRYWGRQYESTLAAELNVVPPLAVVGVEGIYDLPRLLDDYGHVPGYREFVTNAFGDDPRDWAAASPTSGSFDDGWSEGRIVAMLHSIDDELVGPEQADAMAAALRRQCWSADDSDRRLIVSKVHGLTHDEFWQSGEVMAAFIGKVVVELLQLET